MRRIKSKVKYSDNERLEGDEETEGSRKGIMCDKGPNDKGRNCGDKNNYCSLFTKGRGGGGIYRRQYMCPESNLTLIRLHPSLSTYNKCPNKLITDSTL